MKTYELTDKNFQSEVLDATQLVLVDFYAEWCGPCKAMTPVLNQISQEYKDTVKVGKLDVDNQPLTTSQFGIRSMPTLLLFKDRKVVDKIVGAVPKNIIEQKLINHAFAGISQEF